MRPREEERDEYVECPECDNGSLEHEGDKYVGSVWCDTCDYSYGWDNVDSVLDARRYYEDMLAEEYYNRL